MRPARLPVRPPQRAPAPPRISAVAASRLQRITKPVPKPAPAPKPQAPPPPPPPPPPQGLVRGLFVGINYVGTQYELAGCINDAVDIQKHVSRNFPMCKEQRLITDNTAIKPSKAAILESIGWLVAGLVPGQNVIMHYSGHGGLIRDTNGDEASGLDSTLYAINAGRIEQITDDEIRAALVARIPAGCKCFVVFDCCHSGSAVDLRCTWQAPSQEVLTYTEDQKYAKTAGQVLFLSGSHDMQVAMDTVNKEGRPCGAMTMALLATWATYGTAIKLKYLLWDVRRFLREHGYQQIPQLSTGAFMDMNAVFDLSKP
jgi:hypothetical protein